MADAISIQELIDARTDAKTLEEAVNGDAVTTVLSRLGETYPTLSNALNQIDSKLDSADTQIKQGITSLFENGGLPATPFATKALMESSELVDGDYAQVTDDTVNNGLYVKTAGAWVKSAYDPYNKGLKELHKGLYNVANGRINLYFEQGGLSATTGIDRKSTEGTLYTNAVRTDFIPLNSINKYYIAPQDHIKYSVYWYDKSKNFTRSAGYADSVNVSGDGYLRIVATLVDEVGGTLPYLITKPKDISTELQIQTPLEVLSKTITPLLVKYEGGALFLENGLVNEQLSWKPIRVRTADFLKINSRFNIHNPDPSILYCVLSYDSDLKFINSITWTSEDTSKDFSGFIKLSIKKIDGGVEVPLNPVDAEILEISTNFDLGTQLDTLKSKDALLLDEINYKDAKLADEINYLNFLVSGGEYKPKMEQGGIDSSTGEDRPPSFALTPRVVRTPKYLLASLEDTLTITGPEGSEFIVNFYDTQGEFLPTTGSWVPNWKGSHKGFIRCVAQYSDGRSITPQELQLTYTKIPSETGSSSNSLIGKKSYLIDSFDGYYEAPSDLLPVHEGSENDLRVINAERVNEIYDDLVENFPDYVTRFVRGDDGHGNELREYRFTPFKITTPSTYESPEQIKIILIAGIHGNEKNAPWATAEFFKDLCYNTRNLEVLEQIKTNVEFRIIPLVNPRGWNANTRGNTVIPDINRDFLDLVSPEAIIVKEFIDENAEDAFCCIDMHCSAMTQHFYYAFSDLFSILGVSVMRSLQREWKKRYAIDMEKEINGRVLTNNISSSADKYARIAGIKDALVIECPMNRVYFDTEINGEATIKTNIDLLAYTIIGCLKMYNR